MMLLMVLDAQIVVQCALRIVCAGNVVPNYHLNYGLLTKTILATFGSFVMST